MNVNGKRCVITGGTKGIGAATAELFAENGAKVLIVGRDEANGLEIQNGSNGSIEFLKADLSNESDISKVADVIGSMEPGIDILINNASRSSRYSVLDLKKDEWKSILTLNLTSPFLLSKAAASNMINHKIKGKIINISAVQAQLPLNNSFAYSTTKGGILSMTRSMAADLGKHGILVTTVIPGPVYVGTAGDEPPEEYDKTSSTLVGRMGRKIEVAKLLMFLSSDDNSFMTGNSIIIDGGRTVSRKCDPVQITQGYRS